MECIFISYILFYLRNREREREKGEKVKERQIASRDKVAYFPKLQIPIKNISIYMLIGFIYITSLF